MGNFKTDGANKAKYCKQRGDTVATLMAHNRKLFS